MTDVVVCHWCRKSRKSMSDWEQEALKGGWYRLCRPCARRRLNNPFNALLPMRRVAAARAGKEKEK